MVDRLGRTIIEQAMNAVPETYIEQCKEAMKQATTMQEVSKIAETLQIMTEPGEVAFQRRMYLARRWLFGDLYA